LEYIEKTEFSTSSEAADALKLDIILCDLEMPIMDGFDCVKTIRKLQLDGTIAKHIPVIAVTGNAREEQIAAAKAAGMVGHSNVVAGFVPAANYRTGRSRSKTIQDRSLNAYHVPFSQQASGAVFIDYASTESLSFSKRPSIRPWKRARSLLTVEDQSAELLLPPQVWTVGQDLVVTGHNLGSPAI